MAAATSSVARPGASWGILRADERRLVATAGLVFALASGGASGGATGDVVDELACVAPVVLAADLRVIRAARLIRIERIDFEELVDDVPGLAAAVCRALGERARRADDRA